MVEVTLEITRECHLNCLFCSSNGGRPHPNELSLNKWLQIINESINLDAKFFLISGGEPFTSPYFKDICKYISNKGFSFSVYTSGNVLKQGKISSLEKDDVDFLSALNSVKLVFNLQGANSTIHDTITRVQGSFENTLSSIILATSYGLTTEIHFVPVLSNYKELPELVSLAKDLGVKKVSVLRFVPQGRGKIYERFLKLGKEDLVHLKNILYDLTESNKFVRLGSPFSPFGLTRGYKCTAGLNRMTIRFDGLVVPCEAMKFMAKYYKDNNLRKHSLIKIFENSRIFRETRKFHSLMLNSKCNSCSYFNKCKGGCPIQRIIEGKSITESIDPICLALEVVVT